MFYQRNRHSADSDVIDNNILETRGSLYRTVQELGFWNLDNFLNYINDGVVLNLGSGGGGLGVDFEVIKRIKNRNLGNIYSINPRFGSHSEDQIKFFYDLSSLLKHFPEEVKGLASSEIEDIHRDADEINKTRTSNDSWEHLNFSDEFFDKIISTGSYIYYPSTFTETSFLEIYRVLKRGGEMRIGLDGFNINMSLIKSIVKRIEDLNLNLTIEIIQDKDIHNLDILALEIKKL